MLASMLKCACTCFVHTLDLHFYRLCYTTNSFTATHSRRNCILRLKNAFWISPLSPKSRLLLWQRHPQFTTEHLQCNILWSGILEASTEPLPKVPGFKRHGSLKVGVYAQAVTIWERCGAAARALTPERGAHTSIPGTSGRSAQHHVTMGNSSLNLSDGPQHLETLSVICSRFTK